MSDAEKKIIVDDDWKAQARREKEKLSEESRRGPESVPDASFAELVNLMAVQAMVGLGLVGGPGGERYPPSPDVAKHFIDMLQVLEDKTKNNLSSEEKKLLDSVVYELRMRYVQLMTAIGPGAPGAGPVGPGAGGLAS